MAQHGVERETRTVLRNVYVCYFLSGGLGLVYQILWLRKLLLVFGSTVHAVSTVLTVFFGGLALGSWLFGRLIDRREGAGLRWYALLEVGVGLSAFATIPLFEWIRHVYIPIYRASGFAPQALVGASVLCAAAILLLPTTLLGGTFPVLSRFLIRSSQERGVKIASLYGINTAGAMAGTLLVYAIGLPILGLLRTLICAGVLNIGIGLLCLAFDRHLEALGFHASSTRTAAWAERSPEASPGERRWLLLAFGLSGCSAMVYEVAWTRALSLVLGSSIYAFCVMLATFLGGMALGSFWIRRDLRREPARVAWFIRMELALGAYGLASLFVFSQLPEAFVALWPLTGRSFSGLVWLQVSLSAFAMLVPTVLLGALFPLVSDLLTRQLGALGRRLGTAYAINTAGGIVGSFLSGFLLIPRWGLPGAVIAAALVNLSAGALIYVRFGAPRWFVPRLAMAVASLAGAAWLSQALLPLWQREVFAAGVYLEPDVYQQHSLQDRLKNAKLLYYRDSLNATVSVHQQQEHLFLKVGGKTDASTGLDMGTQVLSAHLPLLLHPQPKRVLVIGLGSGVTLGQAGRHDVTTLHCAEIDPAVIEGARYFKEYNDHIHDDPRVRIYAADGRNFLLASPDQYDVIISEPSNPWMAGLGYLFTQEFYQLAKRRLAPGGIMCQWLQLYRMFPRDVKLMLKTFHEEFPSVSVWSSIPGDLLLLGSMEPHQIEYAELARRMSAPAIRDGLSRVKIDRPSVLLQMFRLGGREVDTVTADITWLHQDDQPWLEFSAPKALYLAPILTANVEGLGQFKAEPQAIVRGYDDASEGRQASFHRALGELWRYQDQLGPAQDALERAVEIDPTSAETWTALGEVYLQLRKTVRARDALATAFELDPANAKAVGLLARIAWQGGQLDEAKRLYDQAARVKPPDGKQAFEIAACLKQAGELPWSAEYYRSALSQEAVPHATPLIAYASALKDLKAWEGAEQVIRVGMAEFPAEVAFPLLLGQTLLEQARWRDAEPWLQRALALQAASPEAYYGLGRIALGEQRRGQAVRHLKRALQYDPYHRNALELLRTTTGFPTDDRASADGSPPRRPSTVSISRSDMERP